MPTFLQRGYAPLDERPAPLRPPRGGFFRARAACAALEYELHALHEGVRGNALMMPTIAASLNDADIKAVAAYIASP